jgi:hypothetical protein
MERETFRKELQPPQSNAVYAEDAVISLLRNVGNFLTHHMVSQKYFSEFPDQLRNSHVLKESVPGLYLEAPMGGCSMDRVSQIYFCKRNRRTVCSKKQGWFSTSSVALSSLVGLQLPLNYSGNDH